MHVKVWHALAHVIVRSQERSLSTHCMLNGGRQRLDG